MVLTLTGGPPAPDAPEAGAGDALALLAESVLLHPTPTTATSRASVALMMFLFLQMLGGESSVRSNRQWFAVLVAQARARQDHRGQARVGDVDGQAGGDELALAGLEHQRRVQAGAQVQAGAAGRGIAGHLLGHARVEHFHVNQSHTQSVLTLP